MSMLGPAASVLIAESLTVRFGRRTALANITLAIPEGRVVSVIGSPGAGKTTLLRSFNRMNELVPRASISGTVRFRGADLHDPAVDPVEIRRRIGMVFAEAALFPKSVFDNVVFGLRAQGAEDDLHGCAEEALMRVGLQAADTGILETPALDLSARDRRRLCMARALALEPAVLLLDEPTRHLDPAAAATIESLIRTLSDACTIVVATCEPALAGRISDLTAHLDGGQLLEYRPTRELFTNPRNPHTEAYLTGRTP